MKINQLTQFFEVYPHLRSERADVVEILLEAWVNGDEAGMRLYQRRVMSSNVYCAKGGEE